jgi:caffeoyl-CoA O-methyltransferase
VDITDPRIEKYLKKLAPEGDPLLLEMEDLALGRGFPIVDRLVGRLLFVITRLKKPRLVVELGSGFGYSAYWFARALPEGSTVVLTDRSEENIGRARQTFEQAGMAQKAEFRAGDALDIAREYRDIDILFIDMDKRDYPRAVKALIPHLAPHALIIADNSLWYGRMLEGVNDEETRGIEEFNRLMAGHPEFFTSIVPLRDGVLISLKVA